MNLNRIWYAVRVCSFHVYGSMTAQQYREPDTFFECLMAELPHSANGGR